MPLTIDPYSAVNWETFHQYKASLHGHTDESDGTKTPAQMIDAWIAAGYDIVAITDHDHVTWPWTDFDRDPEELGLLAIQGQEMSNVEAHRHHTASLFNSWVGTTGYTLETAYAAIQAVNGVAVMAHPGNRYSRGWVDDPYPPSFYANFFSTYSCLLGFDICVRDGLFIVTDLWDALLEQLMPSRPVWGFGMDDSHELTSIGFTYVVVLSDELSTAKIKSALQAGQHYVCYDHDASVLTPPPIITEISVNTTKIEITATNYAEIRWISNGKIIELGESLSIVENTKLKKYVRAEIEGENGIIYTNPWGFDSVHHAPRPRPIDIPSANPTVR